MMSNRSEVVGKSIAVVGAGGNIGSHVVSHLARIPGLGLIKLIDPDVYELSNLSSQDITPEDVGRKRFSVCDEVV